MKLHATIETADGKRTVELTNRQGWTMFHLTQARSAGITAFETPALRLAAYVHSLRKRGFSIETIMEDHGGTYGGRHARYKLAQEVSIKVLEKGAAT